MRFLRGRTGKNDEESVVAELLLTLILEALFSLDCWYNYSNSTFKGKEESC